MKKYYTIALCTNVMVMSQVAMARTVDEVLAVSSDAAQQGREIAVESDVRDDGFADSETTLTMVLRNAHGQESVRELRTKTFEMSDKTVGDKSLTIFDKPRDVKGTAFLTHSKILDPDNQWIYLPDLGRVKRISSKNKSGPFMGSEFAYEDLSSQEVDKYSYTYIGQEICPNDATLQCVKVERVPAYKYSGYTKQIGWMDVAEFRPQQIEFYDRKKELLKTLTYKEYKQYLGKYWRAHRMEMVNHQTGKETDLIYSEYAFKTGMKENQFVKSRLKNVR